MLPGHELSGPDSILAFVRGLIPGHIGDSAFVKSTRLFQYDLTLFYTRLIHIEAGEKWPALLRQLDRAGMNDCCA